MTDQQKQAILALSWLPGPLGNKFAAQLTQAFNGDQVAANSYIQNNTNYIWNQAAVVLNSGANTDKWIAKAKKQTKTQGDVPTAADVAVMAAFLRT